MLALGTWTIGQAAMPAAAQAQCNTNSNPAPPPPLRSSFSDKSFGNTPPLAPYSQYILTLSGCNGNGGGTNQSGSAGSPGQPGGQILTTNIRLTIIGGTASGDFDTIGALLTSVGGTGGVGGLGGTADTNNVEGGTGGMGGNGGPITAGFDATFVPDPSAGIVTTALSAYVAAGNGGNGGDSNNGGIYLKAGGMGGAGGTGGSITLIGSGNWRAGNLGLSAYGGGGTGGMGGMATSADQLDTTFGGQGGNGGQGGAVSLQWSGGTITSFLSGLIADASGGSGGPGGVAGTSVSVQGGTGGSGGSGGTAQVVVQAGTEIAVTVPSSVAAGISTNAIVVSANGGFGESGGQAGVTIGGAGGGSGGNGGAGGTATVTILGTVTYAGSTNAGQASGPAIIVEANGGGGGLGANESSFVGQGGGGGFAGAGGNASLTVGSTTTRGEIDTAGNFAHGALVQSVGGGGNGGNANFGGSGGAGAAGGDGGPVTVDAPQAMIIASGKNSAGVLAQSIGGGGGSGGDVTGITFVSAYVIGGNGGLGGDGSTVRINLGNAVIGSLSTLGGAGVLAQSIGGSGGNGGSGTANGSGLISLVVGGDAGGGGTGGAVSVVNAGLVTTYGDHAAGIQAQSIGGGGGKGGSVTSFNAGILPAASIAIGGRGGSGGPGGNVSVGNTGQVTTYGADAVGVLIQSVGGGGGSGGAAAARAADISPTKYIPAISISVATGGKGGDGNTGGRVSLDNSGLITTAGDGAIGVMAQSIGGGGGTGGDSTTASYSNGPQAGVTISIAVSVGGSGGTGGAGGTVSLSNEGLIATLGQDAYGVFAQSVGGGGGTGGAGDASSSAGDAKGSFGASVAVGGTGGTGGDGGAVSLSSSGAITTRGDGSAGVFAQSVGGGGGTAGGGSASAGGGTLSVAVAVGGSGGAGGNGNTVTLNNSGSVVTRGASAIGLSAQSVGGGGGTAGKGAATAGGANPVASATALFNLLAGGLNFGQTVTKIGDDILQIGTVGKEIQASFLQLTGIFSQPQPGAPQNGTAVKINVAVAVGGSGGAAGNGGAVNVTNTGNIITYGVESDGVYAQSVGGGGGAGGAATSTAKSPNDMAAQSAVAVGGHGGGGGSGGTVTVNNGGGLIQTQGVAAFGIVAQSVGGGGGEGSVAGSVSGSLKSLSVGLGGNGGQGGNGGAVNLTTGADTDPDYAIITTGKHGIGVFAQSVGGGGGLARTSTSDETFDPSKIGINPQGRLADIQGVALTLGGTSGSSGGGGPVMVTANGAINTGGLDAHAVLAQSIGGGGGLVAGGQILVTSSGLSVNAGVNAAANAGGGGDGGTVQVQVTKALSTSGNGAYGVIAQSIGGGGGFAGDPSAVKQYQGGTSAAILNSTGNGGGVSVGVTGTTITTSGVYAPAIFAQSVGGGGGLVNYSATDGSVTQVQARGTAGGNGAGGSVSVRLVGSTILTVGAGSTGILLQSDGKSSGQLSVNIDSRSSVSGGNADPNFPSGQPAASRDAAAIRLLGGTDNVITNAGKINGSASGPSFAILADGSGGNTALHNTGTINGDVQLGPAVGNLLENLAGGVVNAPTTINLGAGLLRNAGTLHIGGIGTVGTTTIAGNFVQTATGILVVDMATGSNKADHLLVTGTASLAGIVLPAITDPAKLKPGAVQMDIVTATGGLTQNGVRVALASTPVVRYGLSTPDASRLTLSYTVDYAGAQALQAQGLVSSNRSAVGGALNAVLSAGAGAFAPLTARLAALPTAQAVAATLDSLSGETAASMQQTVLAAQQIYTTTVLRHIVGQSRDEGTASPYAVASLDPVAGPPVNAQGLRVWVGGFGANDILAGSEGQGSLHTQTAGAVMGVEKWFGADRMAGISVGGGSADFAVADRASQGHTTSLDIGLHGLARFGQAYVSGMLAYGNFATDVKRAGLGGATGLAAASRGSVSDDVFGGRIELGWRQAVGSLAVTPFAALEVDHLWQSPFNETASGDPGAGALGLAFSQAERTSVPLTLGARAGGAIQLGAGHVLSLSAELGWQHEFDPQRSVTAAFVAAPAASFRVIGTSASRDAALTGLDAKLSLTRTVALLGSFTGRFSGVETAIGGFGGLQVMW